MPRAGARRRVPSLARTSEVSLVTADSKSSSNESIPGERVRADVHAPFEDGSDFRLMTDEQFAQLLELKHEVFGVEFKPPGLRTDPLLFHTVARGLMGMANRRDGGRLVIGIREDAGKFELLGVTPEQPESWRYEHLADA